MSSGSHPAHTTPSGVSHPTILEPSGSSFDRPVPRVGKYRVLSELGRGGMANVYLAVVHGPGGVNKLVVLKALLPELASEPYALSMFLDEARLAAQLNHPNVVQTYEVGTEGDRHVMVMEYLEGQSLSAILRCGERAGAPLPAPLFLRILISTLEGLHYAHELRSYDGTPLEFVHRDVSPQNIFVTYAGQVKVLDFGIAKAASSSTQTATGIVKGKIAYMAPEQTIADNVDRRADIYSVGCILWTVAAGRKLWKNTPDVQIMRRVINGEVPTPRSVNLGCDDELDRIVMKALALEPDERYQTALEFQQDLEAYSERRQQPQSKQKDVARYVSTLFADTRAELKALIERRLALASEETSSRSYSGDSPALSPTTLSEPRQSPWVPTTGTMMSPPPRRRVVWLALFAVPLLLAGAVWLKGNVPDSSVQQITTPPKVATAATPAKPSEATVQFLVRPPGARLFLDGEELPANLTSKVLPLDGQVHRLRAEADGYTPATAEFSPARDAAVELELDPLPAPRSASTSKKASTPASRVIAKPRPTPPSAPTPSAPPARKRCEEPFYLAPDGIRKLRPECM
jgi:serine/threonine-protein kinase